MFKQIAVHTETIQDYKIHLGDQIFNNHLSEFLSSVKIERAIMMVDSNVFQLYKSLISEFIQGASTNISLYTIPAGEQSKSLKELEKAIDFSLNLGVDRKTAIIAVGGGVIGDLSGYVAASLLRGLPLIHVPTTLLAMVDSSIGGKTGINHSSGKNLIGDFYQPSAIISDLNFLNSLHTRDWINGLSEILKYGIIRDFSIVENCSELLSRDDFKQGTKWIDLITKSAQIKIDIVQQDVLESGVREHLNFGHTFAHAIENFTGYGKITHGEAVYAGMLAALHAGRTMGFNAEPELIHSFKTLYNIDLSELDGNIDALLELMKRDKKSKSDRIRLVLAKDVENIVVQPIDDLSIIEEAWEYIINEFKS